VVSQFTSRLLLEQQLTLAQFKEHLSQYEDKFRHFLSGELRVALLGLLDEVYADPKLELHAALYELSDDELIAKLERLGKKAHVVLANGSSRKTGSPKEYLNKDARKRLKAKGVDVYDRITAPKPLGHNKFAVVSQKTGGRFASLKLWTGSTNWSPTGLCTQVNNGILVENEALAKVWFKQWERLRDAKSAFPPPLVDANFKPTLGLSLGKSKADVWFTRTSDGQDMDYLTELVQGARQGILFTMFNAGAEPLHSILELRDKVFVRGVVNQFSQTTRGEAGAPRGRI
jgi:hypothetical protein